MDVSLRAVTRENVLTVCKLEVAEDQRQLVAPAAFTVAQSHYEPDVLLRAICWGDEPVGVLLADMECDPPYLVRFMVDAAHQRHGIGRRAVDLLIDELRRTGATSLEVSFVAAPEGGAEGFWRRCGFADTGRSIEGETVLALVL